MTNTNCFLKNKLTQHVLVVAAVALTGSVSAGYAGTMGPMMSTWKPVISLGGGVAIVTKASRSQNFPITNPLVNEFFDYYAKNGTSTSGMFDGFFGLEWSDAPKWALQLGVDYNVANSFPAKGAIIQGINLSSADAYTYQYRVFAQQVLAEAKLLYTFKERYHPYLVGGVGAGFVKASRYSTNVPSNLTYTRMYASHSSSSFSWAGGAGLDVDFTSHLRLGVGYRFADFGRVSLGNGVIDTTPVTGTLTQSNFYENQVLGQLTWVFG